MKESQSTADSPASEGDRTTGLRQYLCGFLVAVALASPARASISGEVVEHFEFGAPGRFTNVSPLLDQVGIGSTNVASESVATSFVTPSAGSVDLTFTFQSDLGGFVPTFGFFDRATVTADPFSQRQAWAIQALSTASVVFDAELNSPGDISGSFTVAASTELVFFLLPNNSLEEFNEDPLLFYSGPLEIPLFSESLANPGSADQMLAFADGGVTLLTFEDLSRATSVGIPDPSGFADVAFTVDAEFNRDDSVRVVPEPLSFGVWALLGAAAASVCLRANIGQIDRRLPI